LRKFAFRLFWRRHPKLEHTSRPCKWQGHSPQARIQSPVALAMTEGQTSTIGVAGIPLNRDEVTVV
jgi:hypothetical protein